MMTYKRFEVSKFLELVAREFEHNQFFVFSKILQFSATQLIVVQFKLYIYALDYFHKSGGCTQGVPILTLMRLGASGKLAVDLIMV